MPSAQNVGGLRNFEWELTLGMANPFTFIHLKVSSPKICPVFLVSSTSSAGSKLNVER